MEDTRGLAWGHHDKQDKHKALDVLRASRELQPHVPYTQEG